MVEIIRIALCYMHNGGQGVQGTKGFVHRCHWPCAQPPSAGCSVHVVSYEACHCSACFVLPAIAVPSFCGLLTALIKYLLLAFDAHPLRGVCVCHSSCGVLAVRQAVWH